MTKVELVGVEADIDVLDAHGTVLLAVCGLRIGTECPSAINTIGC